VKIRFYAHANFRLEVDGLAVITDPYTPGPQNSGFHPIDELADMVIMSSATDDFHSDPSHVRGDPTVVNALELPPEGAEVWGLHIRLFPAMESMTRLTSGGIPTPTPCTCSRSAACVCCTWGI
jgi:L-ascorbate metabolism protein UlaG (beta-lactamase superfamily)